METHRKLRLLCGAVALSASCAVTAQEQIVRIGHVADSNYAIAHLGKSSEHGAMLAIEELNKRRISINGSRVKFELIPATADSPGEAVAAAARFSDSRINGVVGHSLSSNAIPASKVYADKGIPFISPSARDPKLTDMGNKTTFRVGPTNDALLAAAAQFAGKVLRKRAVIIESSRFGDSRSSLAAQRSHLEQSKVDVLIYAGPADNARQVVSRGVSAVVLTDCRVGWTPLDADLYCVDEMPRFEGALASAFSKAFKDAFRMAPDAPAAYAYDAVMVMAKAMEAARSTEPAKYLPDLSRTSNYQGVTGAITFDARGNRKIVFLSVSSPNKGDKSPSATYGVANDGTDGGCKQTCRRCCTDKDGKSFCTSDDKCPS